MRLVVYFDGGARPSNPGHGAYGVVIKDADGVVIEADKKYLGEDVTNNEAEWRGILRGLDLALQHDDLTELEVRGDSKLVINQMTGEYDVTSNRLMKFKQQGDAKVHQARERGVSVTFQHVPSGHKASDRGVDNNAEADALVNSVLEHIARPGDNPGQRRLDGRRLIYEEAKAFFGDRVQGRFPWLRNPAFTVRGISFYSKMDADHSLPSVEKTIWEEILHENRERPVLLAYRPFGNRPEPLTVRYHGNVTGGYRHVEDSGGMEMLFAFADTLQAEEAPMVKRFNPHKGTMEEVQLHGYRGSVVMVLRGTWIPASHLRGLLLSDPGREFDPFAEGTDGYRVGG